MRIYRWGLKPWQATLVILIALFTGLLLLEARMNLVRRDDLPFEPESIVVIKFAEKNEYKLSTFLRRDVGRPSIVVYLPSCQSGCGVSLLAKLDVAARRLLKRCQVIVLLGGEIRISDIENISKTLTEWNSPIVLLYTHSIQLPYQFAFAFGSYDREMENDFEKITGLKLWEGGR